MLVTLFGLTHKTYELVGEMQIRDPQSVIGSDASS